MRRSAFKPRSVLDDMFLRALVRDIVRGSFAASLAATAAGCPSDDLTLKPLDEGFAEPTCMDGKWDGLAAIEPSAPFDAAVWRTASAYTPGMDEALVGVPCANAGDMTACNATWDQAGKGDSSIGHEVGIQVSAREYVVVNRGDDVGTVGTRAELLDFLGPIDTPDEAVALARWDGYAMRCNDRELSSVKSLEDGRYVVVGTRVTMTCSPVEESRFTVQVDADGQLTQVAAEVFSREDGVCIGRKPEGLCSSASDGGGDGSGALGGYFARAAHLEAASVIAFEVLADELTAHGAPPSLIALARRFVRDEARHTVEVTALAQRFGGTVVAPIVVRQPVRALEAIALENAVEGCVRETYGALFGAYQAEVACDPDVAACMREIAADEAQHARLSHALHAWLMPRLSPEAQARVLLAQREALFALRSEAARASDDALHDVAGVPRPDAALRLLDSLELALG
jgi:hypothetical protein